MNILERIAGHARRHPSRVAYVCNDLKDEKIIREELTWGDLYEFSDRLGSFIEEKSKEKRPVLVFGHKNIYMPICFLASVKTGRAYVPIDTSIPPDRVKDIIDSVDPELIFCTEEVDLADPRIIKLHEIREIISKTEKIISRENWIKDEEVYYIIFTSGSTGSPKGVQITKKSLENFLDWAITLGSKVDLTDDSHNVFLNQAPFSFDLSVFDLYLALSTGGSLYAISKDIQNDLGLLYKSLEISNINVWVSTPSFADIALSDKRFTDQLLDKLELFLFCGETLTNRTAQRLMKAFPKSDIINTYGPTESTVAVTDVLVTEDLINKFNPLPVGKEKHGTKILIMDELGNVLPEGKSGEIIIVGNTVSLGYWKDELKTAEVFSLYKIDGSEQRLYRTRDKGYIRDGYLYYEGRLDLQIKLHGYRMEIEDIEQNIMKLDSIKKVAVIPNYRNNEVRSLTAYVISNEKYTDDFSATQVLRGKLKKLIPDYMIPKKFVIMESLPITSNGKINRRLLGGNT